MPVTSSLGTPLSTLGAGFIFGAAIELPPLDPFAADPGVDAGLLDSASGVGGAVAVRSVFCLGHASAGYRAFFRPNDYAELAQTDQFPDDTTSTSTGLLHFSARLRPPTAFPPPGLTWTAGVFVDGVAVSKRSIVPGCATDWRDWYFDPETYTGAHAFAFRLTLEGGALPGPPGLPVLELEVPAFEVQHLELVAATAPFIANQVPGDGQSPQAGDPPLENTSIEFDIFGVANPIDTTSVHVQLTISDPVERTVDAVVGGVFEPGYSGTIGPSGFLPIHVSITPAIAFASGATVRVTVTATATDNGEGNVVAGGSATRSWQFIVADSRPPVMSSIQALTTNQLRVTWSKTILAVDPAGRHDGLNPALFYVQAVQPDRNTPCVRGFDDPDDFPSVTSVAVVVAGVVGGAPSVVDLFLSAELTPGITYEVSELGVADTFGNYATSISAVASFVPPAPAGRVFDLLRLLPQMNRAEDITFDLLRFIRCMQEPTNLLLYAIDRWTDILDVDRAPEPMLDAMLVDLGNPFPFVFTVTQKRQLVRLLVAIYKQKGTGVGIVNAIRFFVGIVATITSYTEDTMLLGISELGGEAPPPGGDPTYRGGWILGPGTSFAIYAFRVAVTESLTADQIKQITFIANYMKPANTHFTGIDSPTAPSVYDPVALGISELGVDWLLHS